MSVGWANLDSSILYPSLPFYPSNIHSILVGTGIHLFIFNQYIYQDNLTPHVLSEWMVEVWCGEVYRVCVLCLIWCDVWYYILLYIYYYILLLYIYYYYYTIILLYIIYYYYYYYILYISYLILYSPLLFSSSIFLSSFQSLIYLYSFSTSPPSLLPIIPSLLFFCPLLLPILPLFLLIHSILVGTYIYLFIFFLCSFQSSPILFSSPNPPSFILYLSVLGYTYLYYSDTSILPSSNLSPNPSPPNIPPSLLFSSLFFHPTPIFLSHPHSFYTCRELHTVIYVLLLYILILILYYTLTFYAAHVETNTLCFCLGYVDGWGN